MPIASNQHGQVCTAVPSRWHLYGHRLPCRPGPVTISRLAPEFARYRRLAYCLQMLAGHIENKKCSHMSATESHSFNVAFMPTLCNARVSRGNVTWELRSQLLKQRTWMKLSPWHSPMTSSPTWMRLVRNPRLNNLGLYVLGREREGEIFRVWESRCFLFPAFRDSLPPANSHLTNR